MTATVSPLQIRRTFHASREEVFAAWTEKPRLELWMCRDVPTQTVHYAELDARPGGSYLIVIEDANGDRYHGSGRFREFVKPEKLVFTWSWVRDPLGAKIPLQREESLITVKLVECGPETEMFFTHERLETSQARDEHDRGWTGCFRALDRALHPSDPEAPQPRA